MSRAFISTVRAYERMKFFCAVNVYASGTETLLELLICEMNKNPSYQLTITPKFL